jgi:hypothetical protein
MNDSGLGAMIHAGAWLSARLNLEIVNFDSLDNTACTLELSGDFLAFHIQLNDCGWISLSAQLLDKPDPPDFLCRYPDEPRGWYDCCRLIRAFVRSQVKSLERPLEIGIGGPDGGYVID